MEIRLAESPEDIGRCARVLRELRTHIAEDELADQVRRQMRHGYSVVYVEDDGDVKAVAGYRVSENLAWGRFLYVDDIVTRPDVRSKGYGNGLFDWLVEEAVRQGCGEIHVDSGVQRTGAHRFYFKKRMLISSYHFSLRLGGETPER